MKRTGVPITFVLVLMLISSTVSAQMGGGGSGGMGMMGDEMKMPDMMGMMHGMGMDKGGDMMDMMKMMKSMSRLNLTPDQKKKAQMLKLQHQKDAIPLLGRVHLAGVEIDELLMADPVNLDKVKVKVEDKHDALAELEVAHLALMQQIKGVLTPEQRQRLESMMMEMGPMMGGGSKEPKSQKGAPKAESNEEDKEPAKSGDPHGH